jgi:hypothetical protein
VTHEMEIMSEDRAVDKSRRDGKYSDKGFLEHYLGRYIVRF